MPSSRPSCRRQRTASSESASAPRPCAGASPAGGRLGYFVDVRNVTHVYGGGDGLPAVEDLTVRIREGEFAAIVGPSGCGKSTMMKLATGLQRPKAGTVEVDGREVTEPVKITGMAFQNPVMLPWRTTLQNLLLPLEIVQPHRSRLRANKAEYVARAEALLAQVGLKGMGAKYPCSSPAACSNAPRSAAR